MSPSPLLLLHICAATVGLLSGYLAMARKGSGLHRAAGNVFVVSMLTATAAGAYLARSGPPCSLVSGGGPDTSGTNRR